MTDKINPQTIKLELKSTKAADQRELKSLDIGASSLRSGLRKSSENEELYLVGKTFDGKPVSFNAKFTGSKLEITGFEFEGQKYIASKPFHITLTDGKPNPKDTSSLEDAINYKSASVHKEGLIEGLLGTKDTIKFTPAGRVSSLDIPEKAGAMELAIAQLSDSAAGFKPEHNVLPPVLNRNKGQAIG